MIELRSGTRRLRRHVTTVVGIDRRVERHPAGDFNTGLGKTVELGRIVGEQHDPRAVQHPQHMRSDSVIALIIVKAQCGVGVEGVEAVVDGCRKLEHLDVSQCKNLQGWLDTGGVGRVGRNINFVTVAQGRLV